MNNFFNSNSDFDLFKKALRSTKNEPVVINILSNDSSLKEGGEADETVNMDRKQMSSKFQASPFDKFFGPRKKRTDPVDMKDFSAWKNKNYRESEKQINETPEETTRFSFSDFLNSKTKTEKYNDEDKLKSELQKPIDQISAGDEDYKKFSLDSYLTKLEQETKVKKDFEQTEDLIGGDNDDMLMSQNEDQDENFMDDSDVAIEDVVHGEDEVSGEKFAFDKEELDSVKARLEKMDRESEKGKDKPTTKVISQDEINELKGGEDDDFNLDKLGIEDDIERVNKKIDSLNKVLQTTGDGETETPKVEHKKFFEVNKNFDDSEESKKSDSSNKDAIDSSLKDMLEKVDELETKVDEKIADKNEESDKVDEAKEGAEEGVVKPEIIDGAVAKDEDIEPSDEQSDEDNFVDGVPIPEEKSDIETADETGENTEDSSQDDVNELNGETARKSKINKDSEILTKADLNDMRDEILDKFSELHSNSADAHQAYPAVDEYGNPYMAQTTAQPYGAGYDQFNGVGVVQNPQQNDQLVQQQTDLQAKIVELIEQNKKADNDVAEKLKQAELEKQRVAQEYEARLRELEASMQKREEEAKQQAYIERLKNDIKFKKSETKHKLREEQIRESEKMLSENQLASEKLKSELKNSLNVSNLEMDKKLLECVNRLHKSKIPEKEVVEQEEPEEVEEKPRTRARTSTARRKTSTVRSRMRTRTPRRKIDSDIIGGINFD